MVWLLVLTFMVGKVGADDVVSFEDGFASNRRLGGYDKDDLIDKKWTLHEKNGVDTEHAIGNRIETGSMSDMANFCGKFVAHIDATADHQWRKVGPSDRTGGSSLATGHTYGQGGAYGLAWNQDGYYPDGVGTSGTAKMSMLEAGNAAFDSGNGPTNSAKHKAGHSSTDSVHPDSRVAYGEDTNAISRHETFLTTPVNANTNYQARRLSTKYHQGNFALDQPTNRLDDGLRNGPVGGVDTTYNPEIYRLVNEMTNLDGTDVNYKDEIAARCEGFLAKLQLASTTALSSVRQWMSETEKIRDIARSNCVAGQNRQAAHEQLRKDAIDDVKNAITNMDTQMGNLREKQLQWCQARDHEMDALKTEYGLLMVRINADIDSPAFTATEGISSASTSLNNWDYKAAGPLAGQAETPFNFGQIINGRGFQDDVHTSGTSPTYKNIDVFAQPLATDGDRSAFGDSNSVRQSDASSHMEKRHAEIESAQQALITMMNDGKDDAIGSLDTFYVDPTQRSWNILCDVLKVCKKTGNIDQIVRVSRGAGLAVNSKMGVKAGAVINIDDYDQCPSRHAAGVTASELTNNCLDGYLTSYCAGTSDNPLGSCATGSETPVLHTSHEPATWGQGVTNCNANECDVHQNVPCKSIEGAITAGDYKAGDSAVRQAVEDAVCVEEANCASSAGYVNACSDEVPATRREKVVKHCSTWTDETIRTKRLQYAKLEATTEHIISASANSYLTYFQLSKQKMKDVRDAEYVALENMKTAQSTYIQAYLAHAEALRKANEENQFFMEMVMEAEMMRLAYDQFQHTVTTAQVAAQMTYTKDEKALYQAHQVGAELGATCTGTTNSNDRCVNVPGKADPSDILRKSAMYSTTNKWFGLAQQNLEALIDDPDVKKECCNPGGLSGDWDTNGCAADGTPFCDDTTKHTSPSTEFQPNQESIPADQCVCTLLRDAVGQVRRVQAERRAAIQMLKYMSYNLKDTAAVEEFCDNYTWCNTA